MFLMYLFTLFQCYFLLNKHQGKKNIINKLVKKKLNYVIYDFLFKRMSVVIMKAEKYFFMTFNIYLEKIV